MGEGAHDDIAEAALIIGEWAPENAAEATAVAAPAPVAETTPAQYYYTPDGRRVHTLRTC